MAAGGIGSLYKRTINFRCLTGDALDISHRHGTALEHLDYVQIPQLFFTADRRAAVSGFQYPAAAKVLFC